MSSASRTRARAIQLVVTVAVVMLFPLVLLASFLYIPFSVATNRHGLTDRIAESPLSRLPGLGGEGWLRQRGEQASDYAKRDLEGRTSFDAILEFDVRRGQRLGELVGLILDYRYLLLRLFARYAN